MYYFIYLIYFIIHFDVFYMNNKYMIKFSFDYYKTKKIEKIFSLITGIIF